MKNRTVRISKSQTHNTHSVPVINPSTSLFCVPLVWYEIWGCDNICDQSGCSLTHTHINMLIVFRIHLFTVCFIKTAKYPGGRNWRRPRVSVTPPCHSRSVLPAMVQHIASPTIKLYNVLIELYYGLVTTFQTAISYTVPYGLNQILMWTVTIYIIQIIFERRKIFWDFYIF